MKQLRVGELRLSVSKCKFFVSQQIPIKLSADASFCAKHINDDDVAVVVGSNEAEMKFNLMAISICVLRAKGNLMKFMQMKC